ncbi:MAG: hypothetical protein M5U34_35745 [Chloroflexi bacterium]|nr:hypothetical protein [Chloroflexota bacterium]
MDTILTVLTQNILPHLYRGRVWLRLATVAGAPDKRTLSRVTLYVLQPGARFLLTGAV